MPPAALGRKAVLGPAAEPPADEGTLAPAGELGAAGRAGTSPAAGLSSPANGECVPLMKALQSKAPLATFTSALQASGMARTLSDTSKNFTVFASSQQAFYNAALNMGVTADALMARTNLLNEILSYNIVPLVATGADLKAGSGLPTLEGSPVFVAAADGGHLTLQGVGSAATILAVDYITGCNYVVHAVSGLLMPVPGMAGYNPAYNAALSSSAGLTPAG